ncbi:MAG: HAMP domain-containing protein [Deltaproteobacteria bacterium]|nr:HAMP domain-containing protein [Deltaproteobacteria bacterium]
MTTSRRAKRLERHLELGLRGQLIIAFSGTLAAALLGVATYDGYLDRKLVSESRRATESVAEAMQISVQQLGRGVRDTEFLRDFVRRAASSGIRRITLLDPDRHVVAGSQPSRVLLIEEGRLGNTWELLAPIALGSNKVGYVELRLSTEPLESLLSEARNVREAMLALALIVGILAALWMAGAMTKPLEALTQAARSISSGNLEVRLPPGKRTGEVGLLIGAFEEMLSGLRERDELRAKLESAERAALLGQVAAEIAHDVRNPLNYISLATERLVASSEGSKAAEIGRQIAAQIDRANDKIGELMRVARASDPKFAPIEVEPWLTEVGRRAAPLGRVQIRARGIGIATWDRSILESALANLLTNAIEASPPLEAVELEAETSADEDQIRIAVSDRGAGIPEASSINIFEPWFTTKANGIGLGLAVARRAAETHGGRIEAARRPGGGASLVMTLPRHPRRAST